MKNTWKLQCQKSCGFCLMETIVPISAPNIEIPSSTIRYCCSWDGKHIKHLCRKSCGFFLMETIFPISAPNIQIFQVQLFYNGVHEMKDTTWNFSVKNSVDYAKWKQLFPFPQLISKIPSSTIRHWCSWDERHNRKTSVWILLNGNNYSHSPTLILLSLLYILYTVHFSNRNTTRNEHTAIIS